MAADDEFLGTKRDQYRRFTRLMLFVALGTLAVLGAMALFLT